MSFFVKNINTRRRLKPAATLPYPLIPILILFFSLNLYSETRIRTVEFNFGGYYSSTNLASGTQYNFPARFIKLPENSKVIRSAWLEYYGLAVSATNINPLVLYFNSGTTPTTAVFTSAQYTTNSGESIVLSAKADVTFIIQGQLSNLLNGVYFAGGIKITGPTTNMHTLKLYITYEYDDTSATGVKTVRFPLYSDWTNKVAAFTTPRAAGLSSMYYFVDLPDMKQIYTQWFEITGFKRYVNTTAGQINIDAGGGAEPTMYIDSSLGDSFYFRYLSSSTITPSFSTGTVNIVNINTVNDPIHFLGGEVVITYEYYSTSTYKVETKRQFLGQSATGTTDSVFNGQFFLNEEDITPLELYLKVNGSNDSTTSTNQFSLSSSLNGNALTTQNYNIYYGGALISDWKFVHSLSSQINSFTNGAVISSTITLNSTAGGYGEELFITYKYKNDSAHTTNYGVFSGNNTAVATSYNYNNAPLFWVESGSSKTIKSAYSLADIVAANLNGDQQTSLAFNSNSTFKVTHRTINESPTMFQIYQNLSQVTLSTNSFNINYQNVSAKNSIFNGFSWINYLYTPPPKLPYDLKQKRNDNNYDIPVSSWINTNSVSFYSTLSSSKTYDNLALVLELKPNSTSFDGLNLSTSSYVSYNANTSTYNVVYISSSGLINGTIYKWRVRTIGDGGLSSWVSFSTPSFGVDLVSPTPPNMLSINPVDGSSVNYTNINFSFDNGSDSESGIRNYDVLISTKQDFSSIYFSTTIINTSFNTNLLENKYYWKTRAIDNSGNIGLWSSIRSFIVDITSPTIIDNQSGYDTWQSSNVFSYDIDFQDSLSYLNKFQIKVTTGLNQTGIIIANWTDVVANINQPTYTNNWVIPQAIWDLMQSGTNYVSVRVYDNANNYNDKIDVFYIRKDTIAPTIPSLILPVNNSSTNVTSINFSWSNSNDSLSGIKGYEIAISTSNDFSTIYSSAFIINTSTTITLGAGNRYYWKVKAIDNSDNYSNYSNIFSILIDTISPTIVNNQSGYDTWQSSNVFSYDIDFQDDLSYLNKFQIKVTTGINQSGTIITDWTDVVTDINQPKYTNNWGIAQAIWDLMQSGTNYVSVRVYDNAQNYNEQSDVFYIRKDTISPTIPSLIAPVNNSSTNVTSINFSWNSSNDSLSGIKGYEIAISTVNDFSVIYSSAFIINTSTTIVLEAGNRYYWKVRAIDNSDNYSNYSNAFNVLIDTIAPNVIDNQSGDDVVRSSNTAYYNVHFTDDYSLLNKFQIKATTALNQSGTLVFDWMDVVTDINSQSYTNNWKITDTQFSLLKGGTNYISVRVYDNAGNYNEKNDVFYIVKEAGIPQIIDNQTGFDVWQSSNAFYYDVDFYDPLGNIKSFEVKASTLGADWNLVLTTNTQSYTQNWQLPQTFWNLLNEGTNYISIRVWDDDNNYSILENAFYVLKDTTPPTSTPTSPNYINSMTFDLYYSSSDFSSGVDYVELYYTYETTTPFNWIKYGSTFTVNPIVFTSTQTGLVGFKLIAKDKADNFEEPIPLSTTSPEFQTAIDLTIPLIIDNQIGDDIWRNSGGSLYDVDFKASGLSPLSKAEYKVVDGNGNLIKDWTEIFNMVVSSYDSNWSVDFNALSSSYNYISVRTFNLAGSSKTLENVFYIKKDTQSPNVIDNQLGDNIWRSFNDGYYDIDFIDNLSYLGKFQIKVTTGSNMTGTVVTDWVDVITDINSSYYTNNWTIPQSIWSLMVGGTNYVSVKVFDNAGNISILTDVFYVLKDIISPTIIDNQTGYDVWQSSNVFSYDIDFQDGLSYLNKFQIKITTGPNQSGTLISDWTDVVTNINQPTYTNNWGIAQAIWDLMQSGTNYVSVRVYDNAQNYNEQSDVFYIRKDTIPAQAISNLAANTGNEGEINITFNSPYDNDGSTVKSYIVKYSTYSINESNFDLATTYNQSWTPSPPSSLESKVISGLTPNTLYYVAIKSIDKADNISAISNVASAYSGQDTTPPSAITNLNATPGPYKGSILIEFTSPGDNGNSGTATSYKIRWRDDGLITTQALWDSATKYANSYIPQPAGSYESFILQGFIQGNTYYFNVRAVDDVGLIGGLSNSTYTYASYYPPRNGLVLYQNGTGNGNTPIYRVYDASTGSFKTAYNIPPTDAGGTSVVRHIVLRASPLRNETMAGILSSDGVLQIMRYDGVSGQWTKEWSTTTVTATNSAYRGFDIAYEEISGRCMVLYNGATAGTLYYNIYDGNSWTGSLTLTTGTAYASLWVVLKPRPNSNEIMAAFSKATSLELYATKWNGSSWTDGQQLRNGVGVTTQQDFDLDWSYDGSKLLVVFNAGNTGYAQSRVYSNGAWSTGPNYNLQGANGTVAWVVVRADKKSKYIGVTSVDKAYDWNANIYDPDSNSFISQATENTNIRNTLNQNRTIDGIWNNSSKFIIVAAHASSYGVLWASWTLSGGWGTSLAAAPVFTGWSNLVNGVKLERDKELNPIYLVANSATSNDLRAAIFTGNGFSFILPNPLSTNVTQTTYQPYYFATTLHDIIPPVITENQSGDDVWRSSNTAYYNIDAQDDGGSHLRYIQTKIYSGPNKTGSLVEDWTNQVSTSGVNSYILDWQISNQTFNKLYEDFNYVSVRTVDGSQNYSDEIVDAFYIKKDTTSPTVPSLINPVNYSTINVLSINFSWNNSTDNTSGIKNYQIEISTLNDFSTIMFSSITTNSSILITMPKEDIYFWHVKAFDNAYNGSNWSQTYSFLIDTTTPQIIDNQTGFDVWQSSNVFSYDIDFQDSLSYLNKFQIKITTGANQSGTLISDWTDVVTNINQPSYTNNWQIPQSIWDLIQSGTNYISVRVFDNAGNVSVSIDVFYVLKDTISPQVFDNQTGDDVWRKTNNAYYDVDFYDGISLLDKVQIKSTTGPVFSGILNFDWTDFITDISSSSYTQNFQLAPFYWDNLKSGKNYISFKVYDKTGNVFISTDTFYILKDTTSPQIPQLLNPADNSNISNENVYLEWQISTDDVSGIDHYLIEISTDEYFPIMYSSKAVSFSSTTITVLPNRYFWHVKAFDRADNFSSFSSTYSFFIDTQAPMIIDNQTGFDTWQSSNVFIYDVDFIDLGGSYLNKFQIKATTGPNQSGTVIFDWSDVVTNINQPSYTTDLQIPQGLWDLLPDGTSYISVRVYDNAGNVSVSTDVFYVKKDITLPEIIDNQPGDNIWRSENTGLYNVDFIDYGGSLIKKFDVKITTGPNQSGTVVANWTEIISNINSNLYDTDWKIPDSMFNLLPTGTNYASVRVYDNADNISISTDVFYILKDTMPVSIINNETPSHYGIWLSTNSLSYNVDVIGSGASLIDRIEIAISTIGYGIVPFFVDWTTAVASINANEYYTDWQIPNSVFESLLSNVTNYVSVRAYNQAGRKTTLNDGFLVLKDTVVPFYINNGVGDYLWRNQSAYYDIDFVDLGSGIRGFDVMASTNTNGNYPLISWTNVVSNISSNNYTTNWQIPQSVFDSLIENTTNYISIRVYDVVFNTATYYDVFKVFKDTTPPNIIDNESGDYIWRSTQSGYYDIDFNDTGGSLLNKVQLRVSTNSSNGPYYIDWTDVLVNLSTQSYTNNWQLSQSVFDLLNSGTNYIHIRVYDNANNYSETNPLLPAFFIKKDTISPTIPDLLSPVNNSSINLTSINFSWSSSNDSLSGIKGYEIEISTLSDFSVRYSSAFIINTSTTIVLEAGNRYYWKVKAIDNSDNYSSYSNIFSILIDTILPTIIDNQSGYDTWQSSNVFSYDVDFQDDLSYLNKFQIKITTGENQTGTLISDWTDVVTNINQPTYTNNWGIGQAIWDLMQSGTNYVSVRVYDNAQNYNERSDVFHIRKDTIPPTIVDNQTGYDLWFSSSPGSIFDVDFYDNHSKLSKAVYYSYSNTNKSGVLISSGIIFGPDANIDSYTSNWGVDFNKLNEGYNYISVEAVDIANNTTEYIDVFYIKKDTTSPTIVDLQSGDTNWYNVNPQNIFDVDFYDFGSGISTITIKVTTGPNQTGTLLIDGATIYNGSPIASYTQNWGLSDLQWGLLNNGTNYVSVYSYDSLGQVSVSTDVFYIQKDTIPPQAIIGFNAKTSTQAVDEGTIYLNWTATGDDGNIGSAKSYLIKYATYPINSSNFDLATIYNSTLVPKSVGSYESLRMENLEPQTTYYIAIKAVDKAGNISSISNTTSTYATPDLTPPTAINDLTAQTGDFTGQIKISWTARGEGTNGVEGTNPVTSYIVKYDTYAINSSNFDLATTYSQNWIPKSPGQTENYVLEGLNPGTTYYIAIKSKDEVNNVSSISNVVSTSAALPGARDGVILYSKSGSSTLKYRLYNPPNWSNEYDTGISFSGTVRWSILKSVSTIRNIKYAAVVDSNNVLKVLKYDGVSNSWSDITPSPSPSPGSSLYRNFDIAVEQNSGRLVFAYYNSTLGSVNYAVYSSTQNAWVISPTQLTMASLTGTIYWVKLKEAPNSDNIALSVLDSNSDISAAIWKNGSWINNTNLTTAASIATEEAFDIAWETLTGDLLALWGTGTTTNYRKWYSTSTWGSTLTGPNIADTANWIRLCSSPLSNKIGFTSISGSSYWNVSIWKSAGTEGWSALPTADTSMSNNDKRLTDCAWQSKTEKFLAVAIDNLGTYDNQFDWIVWTTSGWSPASPSVTVANTNTTFSTDIKWVRLINDPDTDNIIFVGVDSSNNLRSTFWSGSSWAGHGTSNNFYFGTVGDFNYEPFSYDFLRQDNIPPTIVDNQSGDDIWRSTNNATYDIDALDSGGSLLKEIQIKAYTGVNGSGSLIFDWTTVVSSINLSSYADNWALTDTSFNQLPQGQSYIWVRAVDNAGNVSSIIADAFYVKKDTIAPTIANNMPADFSNVWTSTGVGLIDIDFSDSISYLSSATYSVYSSTNMSGTSYALDVLISSNINTSVYDTNWNINFSLLGNGTNYITVNVWDRAGNKTMLVDAFKVLKDTIPPNAITNLSATAGPILGTVLLSFSAPGDDNGVGNNTQGGYIIKYATFAITNDSLFNLATTYSNTIIPKNSGAIENIVVYDLNPDTTYYFVIKTYDKANNLSLISNSPYAIPQKSNIFINEVHPGNNWIELYNNTQNNFNLNGWQIIYHQGSVDGAGSDVVVWSGTSTDTINSNEVKLINLAFALNPSQSYSVILKNSDGKIVDKVQWPIMSNNVSFSRIYDGSKYFEIDSTPTPGYKNSISTSSIKINEVSINGWQFIELYNSTSTNVTITNYSLRNSNQVLFKFTRNISTYGYSLIDNSSISNDGYNWGYCFGVNGLLTDDFVVLENEIGQTIDRVNWKNTANTLYIYNATLSNASYAPYSANSIIRFRGEGFDSDDDGYDFSASLLKTPLSRNTNANNLPANSIIYPFENSYIPNNFALKVKLSSNVLSGYPDYISFIKISGNDNNSPHIYKLDDIGFNLTNTSTQTVLFNIDNFVDIDGNKLKDNTTYKVVLITDDGNSSSIVYISSITVDRSTHSLNGIYTQNNWLSEGKYVDIFKFDVYNSSNYGIYISTLALKFQTTNYINLTQTQLQQLLSQITIIKDSNFGNIGFYEYGIDNEDIATIYNNNFNPIDGTIFINISTNPSSYILPKTTNTYFVVVVASENAHLSNPNTFISTLMLSTSSIVDDYNFISQPFYYTNVISTNIFVILSTGTDIWSYDTGGISNVETMINYWTNVYISANDGILRTIDYYTGALKWQYQTSPLSAIKTSPLVSISTDGVDTYIYFGCSNGDVYKLKDNDNSYTFVWKTNIPGVITSEIFESEDKLYFGVDNSKIYCLNKADGNICSGWTFDTQINSPITSALAIDFRSDVNIGWVGLSNGKVIAFRLSDGVVLNQFTTVGPVYSSPFVDSAYSAASNNLFIGSTDGKLYSRVASNLTVIPPNWSDVNSGSAIYNSPYKVLYSDYILIGNSSGKVYKISATTGTILNEFNVNSSIDTMVVEWNGKVYFGSGKYIYALDLNSFNLVEGWPIYIGSQIKNNFVLDDVEGKIMFSTNDGKSHMIDLW